MDTLTLDVRLELLRAAMTICAAEGFKGLRSVTDTATELEDHLLGKRKPTAAIAAFEAQHAIADTKPLTITRLLDGSIPSATAGTAAMASDVGTDPTLSKPKPDRKPRKAKPAKKARAPRKAKEAVTNGVAEPIQQVAETPVNQMPEAA